MYKILNKFKWYRKKQKGHWVKTQHRGWIRIETFFLYIGYGFDPIYVNKEEVYK